MSTYIVSNNAIKAQWGLFSGVKNKEKPSQSQKKITKELDQHPIKSTYTISKTKSKPI
jgi:hypothetical protein